MIIMNTLKTLPLEWRIGVKVVLFASQKVDEIEVLKFNILQMMMIK